MTGRRPYPSDISDARWALIEPTLTAWQQARIDRRPTGEPAHTAGTPAELALQDGQLMPQQQDFRSTPGPIPTREPGRSAHPSPRINPGHSADGCKEPLQGAEMAVHRLCSSRQLQQVRTAIKYGDIVALMITH